MKAVRVHEAVCSSHFHTAPGPRSLLAGFVLLLGACASLPPGPPPEVALPGSWRAPLPQGDSTGELADWWRTFPDPLLASLVERARDGNPGLQAVAARHRQARALAGQARAGLMPQLDAGASARRGDSLDNVPGLSTQSELQFEARWEIDLFGGARAQAEARAAEADATRSDWHAAQVSLAAEVASAYVELRLAQAREELERLDGALAARLVEWGRLQHAAGLIDASGLAQLQADEAAAASRRSAAQLQAQLALQQLAILVGVPASGLEQELVPSPMPTDAGEPQRAVPDAPPFAVETLPARLLGQRPDVAAAHQRWLAALANRRAVDAQRWPQLSLGVLAGEARVSADGQGVSTSSWSLGPSLTLPLFDGGARRAGSAAALAEVDEAAANLQASWQAAVADVEDALQRLVAAREHQRQAVDVAAQRQGIAARAALQARAGLASGPERVAAQRSALDARAGALAAQAEHTQAWIRLYRALGGGWSAVQAAVGHEG